MDLTADATSKLPEIPVGRFFHDVLGIYHRHFWLFMRFLLPATVFGYVAVVATGDKAQEVIQRLHGPGMVQHAAELLEPFLIRLVGWMLSWIVYCFAFAGIAIAVRGIENGSLSSVEESLETVRERLYLFLRLSVVLFILMLLAMGLSIAAGIFLLGMLARLNVRPSLAAAQWVGALLSLAFLLALSKFGLAMPAAILDDCNVRQSLFRSDELTSGRLSILAGLLLKSVVGGYVAAMAPSWIATHVFGQQLVPVWEWWVLRILSFVGILLAEPTMFIGFALLFVRSTQSVPHPFKTAAIT
jgi:hypothetical protein